ncbi:MAG: FAD-dependent oxidoreductase [Betaproteobacteria bacterium]|nr:FAD-dependent oxidoreductase [Betaproteobacteria bacterium]
MLTSSSSAEGCLASAWCLQQRGVRVLLLESAQRPGGTVGSTRWRSSASARSRT